MDKHIIPHAKVIQPYRQGQFDTLCGLYSVINAIRLAVYPERSFTKYHSRIMMEEGLKYLDRRKTRLLSALTEGMSNRLRLALANHVIKFASEEWGVGLKTSIPNIERRDISRAVIVSFIKDNLHSGNPVCINLMGHHQHYTVICGYNQRSFFLYDSDGLTSVHRLLVSILSDKKGVRHELDPKGLISITLKDL